MTHVRETGDMPAGSVKMLTLTLAPGHCTVLCNLPGHHASGMHQDLWVAPTGSTF